MGSACPPFDMGSWTPLSQAVVESAAGHCHLSVLPTPEAHPSVHRGVTWLSLAMILGESPYCGAVFLELRVSTMLVSLLGLHLAARNKTHVPWFLQVSRCFSCRTGSAEGAASVIRPFPSPCPASLRLWFSSPRAWLLLNVCHANFTGWHGC